MMGTVEEVQWHDDKCAANRSLKRLLERAGTKVREIEKEPFISRPPASTSKRRFIVDNKLVHDRPTAGTQFAFDVTKSNDVRVIVYSAFIEAKYRDRGVVVPHVETKSAILFVPKPHVGVANLGEFESDLASTFKKFLSGPWNEVESLELPIPREALPDSRVSYREFEQFPLSEKRRIYRHFRDVVQADLEALFNDGAIWIFYAGASKEPYKIAYGRDDVMPTDEVARLCGSLDCIPYIFRRDVRIDSTGCNAGASEPGSPASLEYYPFAEVTFLQEGSSLVLEMHLDTGADYTVISDRFIDEQAIPIRDRKTFGSLRIHGRDHQVDEASVDVLLGNGDFEPARNAKHAKEVRFLAIDEWEACGLMVHCGKLCTRKAKGSACQLRAAGLLGRTLYHGVCKFDLFLNAETSRVNFVVGG